ncbi:hypothetical protein BELL_0407g00100 [Botrytis elliptica]|uniref:2EXR domain-containing protein n=1 Tax=Botrytis elliptica TaxID=278938 RepID=A0A4Z1JH52_9HELO|nr:hypothetical protein EAE99_004318 [Botrytis elliptica]TGO72918.1 hypothetical protein BELL_0407g00100 [Botrytis elliptica]
MAGSKNEFISGLDVPNNPAIETARVMKNHGHPSSSDSINESGNSIITVANMQTTNDLHEDITHEKNATIEESTVNLELTEGPLVCPWGNTSPDFLLKNDSASNGMRYRKLYLRNFLWGEHFSTWVELERRSSHDTFTCFPRLPHELRRKIWLHALPEPRTISIHLATDSHSYRIPWSDDLKSHLITATLCFDDDSSANLSSDCLLWICRESSEIFLKHYRRPRGVRPVDGKYHCPDGRQQAACVRVQSKGWIDFEVDTLVARNLEHTFYELARLQSRPDLSAITNLTISETPLYEASNDPWWTNTVPFLIEEQFPRLKHLSLIANHAEEAVEWKYSRGHFGPLAVVKATDVNFMNELKRVLQIDRLSIFDMDNEEFTDSGQKDAALAHPKVLEMQFLHGANMSYWKNVEVTLAFLVHWEKDGEALPFDGLQPACENHLHFTFSPYPTGKMHIRWWGQEYVIPTDEDGIANGEYWGVRELFDDHETSDRPKPSQWPWNYGYDIVVSRGSCWVQKQT